MNLAVGADYSDSDELPRWRNVCLRLTNGTHIVPVDEGRVSALAER